MIATQRAAYPDAVIALVSGRDFALVTRAINLFRGFINSGLFTLGADGKVAGVPVTLTSDPAAGIADIADAREVAAMGGNPQASYFVNFKIGTSAGTFASQAQGLTGTPKNKGTHGWFPAAPEMRATFLIMGPGIPAGKSLGEIDQRAIAPTLAGIMGAKLGSAEVPGLKF